MRGEETALHICILDTAICLYTYVPGYDLMELGSNPSAGVSIWWNKDLCGRA